MPSVYLIQYSVSSTETPGESLLPLRRKRNGASVRERSWPWWCKAPSASWPLHIYHLFSSVSPFVLPFISLATPVRFRDTAAARVQLLFQILRVAEHCNKGRGLSISSLLSIVVLKFQLWNLFCATAWNRNVGAVPNLHSGRPQQKNTKFRSYLRYTAQRDAKEQKCAWQYE